VKGTARACAPRGSKGAGAPQERPATTRDLYLLSKIFLGEARKAYMRGRPMSKSVVPLGGAHEVGIMVAIRWYGQSCFEIREGDLRVVTDPHDGKSIGLPAPLIPLISNWMY